MDKVTPTGLARLAQLGFTPSQLAAEALLDRTRVSQLIAGSTDSPPTDGEIEALIRAAFGLCEDLLTQATDEVYATTLVTPGEHVQAPRRAAMQAGDTFGLLTVIERIPGGKAVVQCACGTTKTLRANNIANGATRTCGSPQCRAQLREQKEFADAA